MYVWFTVGIEFGYIILVIIPNKVGLKSKL
uniref:Uncharacterized protein n=1 Tax=Rhizophora mucronata TaxID=61149 RepID=A0A2P2NZQ2_RHIMU